MKLFVGASRGAALRGALLVLALCAPSVRAADPTPVPANEPPSEAVAAWTQDALQQLLDVRAHVEVTPEGERQLAALEELRRRYDESYEGLRRDPSQLDRLSESALQDTRSELEEMSKSAEAFDRRLTEGAAELEGRLREVLALRDRARATLTSTSAAQLPSGLRVRLERIVDYSAPVQRSAEASLDRLARAQSQVLRLKERVDGLRALASATSAKRVRELFRFDEPRLWTIEPGSVAASARHSGTLVGASVPEALRKFASEHIGGLVLHAVLFALVLAGMFRLRRVQDERATPEQSKVLARPFSAAILLTLLITPAVHPEAPSVVRELAVATLIAPMVRILILYFDRRIWPELFTMIGLFFVERLLGALAMEVLVQRLGLLALSVATAAFFLWVLRSQAQAKLGLDPPAQRWTRLLFVVALVASIVAIPLNVYGNLGLALAIQSAVVRCVLLAATLRALVVVVREVGRLITHALEQRGWRAIARHRTAMMERLDTLTVVGGATIWAYYTLVMMRVDEIVLGALRAALGAEAKIGEVTLSVSRVLAFVAAVWIAVRVSGMTRALLNDDVLPRFALPRGVPNAISVIANYTIVLIGLMIGAGILGISFTSLTLIVGALGVGIGFGLQNIVNNFVSGMILVFERPVQVGDAVEFDQLSGVVTQIGFRASRIRTYSGSDVIVPNGDLVSRQLINWTLSDRRRRLELPVTVAYGSDCELVERTLLEVASGEKEVMVEPQPIAVLESFGPSALEFRLYCWVADYDIGLRVKNRLNQAIIRALLEAGVEVPGARREVFMMPPPA